MSIYILPLLFVSTFIYAKVKKVNVYNSFVAGAKKSVDVVLGILPYIIAIMVMVTLMRVSGLSQILSHSLAPVFTFLGIPSELCELVLLKPFSGSGSLALLNDIYAIYGVDSYIGKCASVIISSSDTVFYISTLYFSGTKVKKLLYAIPVALIACLLSVIVACLLCKIF